MVCPKCKKDLARRAERTSTLDHAASRVFFKPWLCPGCNHRYYALSRNVSVAALRAEMQERISHVRSPRKPRKKRAEAYVYLLAAIVIAAFIYFLAQQRA